MPDLLADYAGDNTLTNVGVNYKKAAPSSAFGTPTLGFYKLATTEDIHVNYADANSLFAKAVLALQEFCEMYMVGTPAAKNFVFVVNDNTFDKWDDTANTNANFSKAEAAVNAITGLSGATITQLTASGASIA